MFPYIPNSKKRSESQTSPSRRSVIRLQQLLDEKEHTSHSLSARPPPRIPPSPRHSEARADSAPGHMKRASTARGTPSASPAASPSPRRVDDDPTTKEARKYRAVAFVDGSDFSVHCPQCGTKFSAHDDILFRRHVFECRDAHGVDPLMPLHLVLRTNAVDAKGSPRSSAESTASTNFNGVSRPIHSTLRHVDLFEGVPLTPKLEVFRHGAREMVPSLMGPSTTFKTALLSTSRVLPYATPSPPASKPSTSQSPPAGRKRQVSMASRGNGARKGVVKPPTMVFAPGSMDAQVETALMAALNEEGDECVLDLTGLTISHRQSSRIEAVLAPNDGTDQLPVSKVILTGTKVVGEETAQRLFAGILKNKYVEVVEIDERTSKAQVGADDEGHSNTEETNHAQAAASPAPKTHLTRLLAKTRFTAAGLQKALDNNVQRRKEREANGEFLDEVDAYLMRGKRFNEGVYALIKRVNTTTEQLQRAEAREREKLTEWIAKAKARDVLRRRRLEHDHMLMLEREAFFIAEERRRVKVEGYQLEGICALCEREEGYLRECDVSVAEQLSRSRLKMEERENIWRCLVVRDHRRGFHVVQRQFMEEEAVHGVNALLNESLLSLEGLKMQQGQHHKVSLWRRRMREEVENFVRYEVKLRENVLRDEDSHWTSSKEKFFKAVEATTIKVGAQRQFVEDSERIRRRELESVVGSYLDLELQFFRAETRLLVQRQKTALREGRRRDLLAKAPTLTIATSTAQPEVLLFATQTPKHAAPDPISLFSAGFKVCCGMHAGWADDLSQAEQLCKTSVAEERVAITEYVQLLRRSLPLKNEAFSCASDEINEEPSMETLLAIHRPTPVFASAWKGRSQSASALRPSMTLARASAGRGGKQETIVVSDDDDEAVSAEIDRILDNRCAWYDKVPIPAIRAAKEQIYRAKLTISFMGESNGDATETAHQLLSSIGHLMLIAQTKRCAEVHRLTQERVRREMKTRQFQGGNLDDDDDDERLLEVSENDALPMYVDPQICISLDGTKMPSLTITDPVDEWVSVARSRAGSLVLPGGMETSIRRSSVGSDATLEESMMLGEEEEGDEGLFEVPALVASELPPARRTLVVEVRGAELSDSSTMGILVQEPSTFSSARRSQFAFLDPEILPLLVESVMYRAEIDEGGAGSHKATLKKLQYTLEADVHLSECYHKHHPDLDHMAHVQPAALATPGKQQLQPSQQAQELYVPRQPLDHISTITVSTTGSYHVGAVPSCIAVNDDIGARFVAIEGQMDGIPIVRGITSVSDPFVVLRHPVEGYEIRERSTCSMEELKTLKVSGGLSGGSILVEVVGEGASNGDRLSLEDELPNAVRFDAAQDRVRAIRTVFINDFVFAVVTEGILQMTGSVTPSVKRPRHGSRAELRIDRDYSHSHTTAAISTLLSKLRYHNYDSGPEEGTRELRICVRSSTGAVSEARISFIVEAIDKPTELRLPYKKLTYRSPSYSIPTKLQVHCTEVLVPVCYQALVVDEDTDRFSGGYAKFILAGGCKGDSLAFCPDSRLHNFIEEATEVPPLLSVGEADENGCREVFMEDRVVATLEAGPVIFSRENLADNECSEIRLSFAQEDACSIAAVQAICRAVVLVNSNPAFQFKTHPMGQRDVHIDIQIMDNEQACQIVDNVSIKGGAHTVHLLERGTNIDFKEGSQPCKLGYFDLNSDKINPINNFGGGWILATVAVGGDSDVLGLRQEEGEYRIIEPKMKRDQGAGIASTMLGKLRAVASVAGKFSSAASMNASTASTFARSTSNFNSAALSSVESRFPGIYNGFQRPVLVHFAGMTSPMAAVMSVPNGILIQFFADTKRDAITRKHALTLLRNITYYHDCQAPLFTQKVARVLVSDHPSSTACQCLVQINLEVTDDVTEIRVKSPRKRMVQAIQNNFPLFPYGRAVIHDMDTEFFDGATFTVQCVAGSTRGDAYSFVPPYEQAGFVQRTNGKLAGYTCSEVRALYFSEDQRVAFLNGTPVAKIDYSYRDNGTCEVRVTFEAPLTNSATKTSAKTSYITRDVFSYIVNSICFGNQAERLRDASRVIVARIKDPGNPVEGKLRMTVDVAPPHMVLAPPGATFDAQLFTKMPISPEVGSGVNPGSRIVVNLDRIHDLPKSSCGVMAHCRISVTCGSPEQLARVRLFLPLDEHGLKLYAGGNIAMSNGSPAFQLDNVTQHSALLTFLPGSKPSAISREKLQAILRSVVVSVTEELAVATSTVSPALTGEAEDTPAPPVDAPDAPPVIDIPTGSMRANAPPPTRLESEVSPPLPPLSNTPRKPTLPRKTSNGRLKSRDRKGSVVGFITSPVTQPPALPAAASLDNDDADDATIVVTWSLHDGENESRIVTRLVPKRM